MFDIGLTWQEEHGTRIEDVFEDVFPMEYGDVPASYGSLPEGTGGLLKMQGWLAWENVANGSSFIFCTQIDTERTK